MAATFAPPHTVPVFRTLKTAWREYVGSGNAAALTVPTPANQAATASTTVTGTLEIDPRCGVPMPATVSVSLKQGATVKATQAATVNPTTGAFSTTFPANTLSAGSCVVLVTSQTPWKSIQTPPFVVT